MELKISNNLRAGINFPLISHRLFDLFLSSTKYQKSKIIWKKGFYHNNVQHIPITNSKTKRRLFGKVGGENTPQKRNPPEIQIGTGSAEKNGFHD